VPPVVRAEARRVRRVLSVLLRHGAGPGQAETVEGLAEMSGRGRFGAGRNPPRERSVTPARPAVSERRPTDVDALVTTHLPLAQFAVNAVASRISLPSHVNRDDLLSCASVALVEVARRFDPTAGATFATYALPRLQGAVLDELRSGDWASRSVRAAARRTDAATDALTISLGRPPTREELADSLGVARSDLDSLQIDVHRAVMVSIDAETGTEGGSLDLPDTGDSPERALLRGERARHLHEAIAALPDRLDEVVERNFFGDESLTDIADSLGVTLSRVSQMRARALTLLHAAMSEVWDGTAVAADGGVRARNQQRAYVDRVAARQLAGRGPAPAPAVTVPRSVPGPRRERVGERYGVVRSA
jgi:RNA polymerase sigma factor for flagellar operon FliA